MWRKAGRGVVLGLRYLYGLFYLFATINKLQKDYAFSDYPLQVFTKQLAQVDPDGIMARWMTAFLIPNYRLVGILIVVIWIAVTIGLLLGLCTRWAGALAVFAAINIGLGGFYDASLIPLAIIPLLFVFLPTGHWFGFDRVLHARYPDSWVFK